MRKSRLKTGFWLVLGVLTIVCSSSGSLLAQNNWSVEDQSGWLGQTWNPQVGGDSQASLLRIRPRENGDWLESGYKGMIGLDKGSSIGNALGELRLRPEPVTLAVLMISNLVAVSVRITRKYRLQLR